jgi:hypothetical protein
VSLRILAQKSPESELRLKRCGGKKFEWLKYEFGSLRGLFGNIEYVEGFSLKRQWSKCNLDNIQGPRCKVVARNRILFKYRDRNGMH